MKVLFLIGAVLVLAGTTSATLSDSFTIGFQYAKLVADVNLAIHNLKAYTIQLLGDNSAPYLQSFLSMEDYFKNLLMQLGQTGTEIYNRVEMKLDEEVKKLIMMYNPTSLNTFVNTFLLSNQSMYLTQVNAEMTTHIIEAIENSKVITCWNTYSRIFKRQFTSDVSRTRKIINGELLKLAAISQTLAESIFNAVKAVETEFRNACGSDSTCYVNYIVTNEQTIQDRINLYYNGIMAIFNNELGAIGSKVTSAIQTAMAYLSQVNTNFATCYA